MEINLGRCKITLHGMPEGATLRARVNNCGRSVVTTIVIEETPRYLVPTDESLEGSAAHDVFDFVITAPDLSDKAELVKPEVNRGPQASKYASKWRRKGWR